MSETKKVKKPHLGRGLEALLGPMTKQTPNHDKTETVSKFPPDQQLRLSKNELSIDQIEANPYQPRTVWDEEKLGDLAQSIKENGIIQPIIVRKNTDGYEIIAGERRYRAACMAGLDKVPVL